MSEKELLLQLLDKNEIRLDSLKYVSNVEIAKFISKYESESIIEYQYGIIKLTEKGKLNLLQHRKYFFLLASERKWAQIPEEMKIEAIEINKQTNI